MRSSVDILKKRVNAIDDGKADADAGADADTDAFAGDDIDCRGNDDGGAADKGI